MDWEGTGKPGSAPKGTSQSNWHAALVPRQVVVVLGVERLPTCSVKFLLPQTHSQEKAAGVPNNLVSQTTRTLSL